MKLICLLALTLLTSTAVRSQKAWPGDITTLLAQIPVPSTSAACYGAATKQTDPANNSVSIVDNGVAFKKLQDQLEEIGKSAYNNMAATSAAHPTPTGASSASDIAVMKLVGQAQTSAIHINQLGSELALKMSKLSKAAVQAVKQGPNCPEVQQGGYAGPTCACLVAHATEFYSTRVVKMDEYITQVADLIRDYLAKIKAEAAVVDDMEAKAKYGDAVANPGYKQMAVSIQRQAIAGVTILLSLSSGAWYDGSVEYSNLINAKSGASSGCNGK
jgi:hypothetical protein